jgi:hypothetical protein
MESPPPKTKMTLGGYERPPPVTIVTPDNAAEKPRTTQERLTFPELERHGHDRALPGATCAVQLGCNPAGKRCRNSALPEPLN